MGKPRSARISRDADHLADINQYIHKIQLIFLTDHSKRVDHSRPTLAGRIGSGGSWPGGSRSERGVGGGVKSGAPAHGLGIGWVRWLIVCLERLDQMVDRSGGGSEVAHSWGGLSWRDQTTWLLLLVYGQGWDQDRWFMVIGVGRSN